MTSSSHISGTSRRNRDHGSSATKKQQDAQQGSKAKSSSKEKIKHDAQCQDTKVHRRKSSHYGPHEYTPFHHLSLDVMDGILPNKEQEFGPDPEHGPHDYEYIGEESTTILTPSYDDTTSSTIPTYFDEDDTYKAFCHDFSPYARTTHDLQYIGHWVEAQGVQWDVMPSHVNAMNIGYRYSRRAEVRDVMVGIEIAFSSVEQRRVYETVHT